MSRHPVVAAISTGIALSGVTAGAIGFLEPFTSIHLSASLPADYVALSTAPDVSLLTVFVITAGWVAVCLFVGLRRQEKRNARARAVAAAELETITEESVPC